MHSSLFSSTEDDDHATLMRSETIVSSVYILLCAYLQNSSSVFYDTEKIIFSDKKVIALYHMKCGNEYKIIIIL